MKLPPASVAAWSGLAAREKLMVIGAAALVGLAIFWWVLVAPALSTLRTSGEQHRELDAQLARMRALQQQAQSLQAQPKQGYDESMRQLDAAVRQRLGTGARMTVAGDRVTLTLAATPPDALAAWLAQARVNARAVPGEAHLTRNAGGGWDGTLVLTLPPR
ncbi:type II secretion system protein GspM [Ramlibacter humi]|uniref:Type II secretion system protein M n=1 Tax=Ramlibacter humi TaxID=2530451 RepID=A0A4Z0BX99_9BURK|nr:type II secretion system protein GspM [Ramlibacter humi]TFZ03541.1 type II secretion system protein M [Ramlibacter humi]